MCELPIIDSFIMWDSVINEKISTYYFYDSKTDFECLTRTRPFNKAIGIRVESTNDEYKA
jgi:hypothetical protein